MKQHKKKDLQHKDDTLFGLLSAYKKFTSYLRVMINPDDNIISVQITSNPKSWDKIDPQKYEGYQKLRRIDMGCSKSSIKYLSPELLINVAGPLLGIKIPPEKCEIVNRLVDRDLFILETSDTYKEDVLEGVSRLLTMPPQKKYELLEKFMSNIQE